MSCLHLTKSGVYDTIIICKKAMTGSKQPPYRIMSFPDDNGFCLTYESNSHRELPQGERQRNLPIRIHPESCAPKAADMTSRLHRTSHVTATGIFHNTEYPTEAAHKRQIKVVPR